MRHCTHREKESCGLIFSKSETVHQLQLRIVDTHTSVYLPVIHRIYPQHVESVSKYGSRYDFSTFTSEYKQDYDYPS